MTDLDLIIMVLAQGTRRSRLSKERRGRKDEADKETDCFIERETIT